MHTKDDTWYEMLSNPASLKPTKANSQLPSHCPKMGTKKQNNVKIEHKGKEFVLWAWQMKAIRNHLWMLGRASVSRTHFIDDGGLPDWATCVNTARVQLRAFYKGPRHSLLIHVVTGKKRDSASEQGQLKNQGIQISHLLSMQQKAIGRAIGCEVSPPKLMCESIQEGLEVKW